MKISVCIPTYEYQGQGKNYLKHSLDILAKQTFKDFEAVVSDDSTYFAQAGLEALCKGYPFVKYIRNKGKKGICPNINNAMGNASGEIIKILFQDDFLYDENSLQKIADNFKGEWMVTACEHSSDGVTMERPFYPHYNHSIHLGNNTISSPSVLSIRNKNILEFDENLVMLLDCDYYRRCYDKFGEPTILNEICVVNRTGKHQVSMNVTPAQMSEELDYIKIKYV